LCVEKGDLKTFELLKIKSVAAVVFFAVLMVSASVYTMHETALADTTVDDEKPECTVLFSPATTNIAVGETFNVTVLVDDVKNLYGFEIGLVFNREVIEYVGAKTPQWRFIGGKLEWIFWAAGTTPQNGEVDLMMFTFRGIAAGSSSLSLSVHKLATSKYWEMPHDYVGWPIPHVVSEGFVTVS
jgi:hypothetical protein